MGINLTNIEQDVGKTSIGGNIAHIAKQIETVLEGMRSSGIFYEYTEHNIEHSRSMLLIYEWLIPQAVYSQLNEVEKYLLVLAAYFHDVGMMVSNKEKEEILKNSDEKVLPSKLYIPSFNDFKSEYDGNEALDESFMLQEYIRKYHHIRSAIFIELNAASLGVNERLIPILADICKSHCEMQLEDGDIYKTEYPFNIPGHNLDINIQYIAIILRLADILDVSDTRTPKVLYKLLNPTNPKSILEWKKHMSIRGIKPSESMPGIVNIGAECREPQAYFEIEEYCKIIRKEIDYCRKLLLRYNAILSSKYYLDIEDISTEPIRTDGFVKGKLNIEAEPKRIVELFMGNNIYAFRPQYAVIRELLTNSVDACRLRAEIEANYKPEIHISYDSNKKVLQIDDNGIGMNDYIISNYLLKVGRSYYRSDEFIKKYKNLKPISKFGIGFLSSFLLAERVEVYTRYYNEGKTIQLEFADVHNNIVMRFFPEMKRNGTLVKLFLKAGIDSIEEIVKHWASHLGIRVFLSADGLDTIIDDEGFKHTIEISTSMKGEEIKGISLREFNLDNEYCKGIINLLLSEDNQIVDTMLLRHNESIVVKGLFHRTSYYGIALGTELPLPDYWDAHKFTYDIDIRNIDLDPSLDRLRIKENTEWTDICFVNEKMLIPQFKLFINNNNYSQGAMATELIQRMFHRSRLEDASQDMKDLLNRDIKWVRSRTSLGAGEWGTLDSLLEKKEINILPQITKIIFPSLISDERQYNEAIRKCNDVRNREGVGTVDLWNYDEMHQYVHLFIKPKSVDVNSRGYSVIQYSLEMKTVEYVAKNIIMLPFSYDNIENESIIFTVCGPFLVCNKLSRFAKLIHYILNSKNKEYVRKMEIYFRKMEPNYRSGFFVASNKDIARIQENTEQLRKAVNFDDEIRIDYSSFASHDFVEYWTT